MKTQVIAIHGGETFDTYEDYISYLKNTDVSLENFKPSKGWKNTLAERLGDSYEILLPIMPNKTNARYEDILTKKVFPKL
jgi:hypothetical protein